MSTQHTAAHSCMHHAAPMQHTAQQHDSTQHGTRVSVRAAQSTLRTASANEHASAQRAAHTAQRAAHTAQRAFVLVAVHQRAVLARRLLQLAHLPTQLSQPTSQQARIPSTATEPTAAAAHKRAQRAEAAPDPGNMQHKKHSAGQAGREALVRQVGAGRVGTGWPGPSVGIPPCLLLFVCVAACAVLPVWVSTVSCASVCAVCALCAVGPALLVVLCAVLGCVLWSVEQHMTNCTHSSAPSTHRQHGTGSTPTKAQRAACEHAPAHTGMHGHTGTTTRTRRTRARSTACGTHSDTHPRAARERTHAAATQSTIERKAHDKQHTAHSTQHTAAHSTQHKAH